VILDVLNRMIPGVNDREGREISEVIDILEKINRELDVTLLILEHTIKGDYRAKENRTPDPLQVKGGIEKYGCADFMIVLVRKKTGQLDVYVENKDSDMHPRFLIVVSPKGSGEAKFTWAGDAPERADSKETGEQNLEKVYEALGDECLSRDEVQKKTGLKKSAVIFHLSVLVSQRRVERLGFAKKPLYRKKSAAGGKLAPTAPASTIRPTGKKTVSVNELLKLLESTTSPTNPP